MTLSSDKYFWIGSSGGLWGTASNWQDVTAGQNPASSAPGSGNAVTIAGATGSIYEVIGGGGAAASLSVSGLVELLGSYTTGMLSVATPPASGSTSLTGSLELGAGASLQATSVSVGLPTTYNSAASYVSAAAGTLTVTAGAALSTSGTLTVGDGSLVAQGSGASVSIGGNLILGTANPSSYSTYPYSYAASGSVSVSSGAIVTVAGAITEKYNYATSDVITVNGAGSRLSGGTLALDTSSYYQYVYAASAALCRLPDCR